MSNLPRRLPGVRIEVAPPPADLALPRMDVAVLVGFASTGPLHQPVAVESAGQFAAVFGADAPLALDAARGERVLAHLGSAVRSFFANGGTRCWVIRVARSAALEALWRGVSAEAAAVLPDVAQSNRHVVPGVLAVDSGHLQLAVAQSRCEGSWSDGLRLSSALVQRSVSIDSLIADGPSNDGALLSFHCGQDLQVGDLLQLGDAESTCAYAVVDATQPGKTRRGQDVRARLLAAFERLQPVGAALLADGEVSWAELAGTAIGTWQASTAAPKAELVLQVPWRTRGPSRSNWARWTSTATVIWLRIDDIRHSTRSPTSPSSADALATSAVLAGPAWLELGGVLPAALRNADAAQVLTLDLRAEDGTQISRLRGVGLTPTHPASWWQQVTDAQRYRIPDGSLDQGPVRTLTSPGFPLAPPSEPSEPSIAAWLPLGVQALFGEALEPLIPAGTALERDGLSRCDAELFLDPDLADTSVGDLVRQADAIRLMQTAPRALFGLHACLGIGSGGVFNEASLLAMPDAVHLGWQRRVRHQQAVAKAKNPDPPLFWQTHRGGCVPKADPAEPGKPTLSEPDFGCFLDSDTRLLDPPMLSGPAGDRLPGAAPLEWTSNAAPGIEYVLEEARQADFVDARQVYRGLTSRFDAPVPLEGMYYFRVHAELRDQRSAPSSIVPVAVSSSEWVQNDPATEDAVSLEVIETRWLPVHRAALRLGAATGELFAVLALPRHFRTPQVLRYVGQLRNVHSPSATESGEPDALAGGEASALSYGALYHPWLQSDLGAPQVDAQTGNVVALRRRTPRFVPPDGIGLGVLAARAVARGAWVAPANELFRGVVALAPAAPASDLQVLQDAQVNVVRADPRGLMALSADTLAQDSDLRPINVRRLLILLRRLALQRGNRHVFEPLGPILQRAVQRSFDELLTDLFRRGAFAGSTPEQSFRVVVDDTVNTPRDADRGRLVVELRVAPALPMRFVTLRLTQSGERLSVTEAT